MTKGWQCPKCSRCYAPTTAECQACNDAVMVARELRWNTAKRQMQLVADELAYIDDDGIVRPTSTPQDNNG